MTWGDHDTLQPLGDARVQITVLSDLDALTDTGLLTVRGKEHDLTAEQWDRMAEACRMAAERLRRRAAEATANPSDG